MESLKMENRNSAGIYFDTLPEELQILIFSNIELKLNCSLVCCRFYELCYIVGQSQTVMKFNWSNKSINENMIKSMMKSQRKIKEIKFSYMDCISKFSSLLTFKALNLIATHFGANVMKFELIYCTISEDQLVQILNLLPKLLILKLNSLNFNFNEVKSCTKLLTLPVLQELHLVGCDWSFEEIFTSSKFEKNNLKTIKLAQHRVSDCFSLLNFNQLSLEHLMLLAFYNMDYVLITIKSQQLLTALDLHSINDEIFDEIVQLKNLKVLKLSAPVLIRKFIQITKLELLETLQLHTSLEFYIKELSKIRMMKLKHLKIHLITLEDFDLADELKLIAMNHLSLLSVDISCGFIPENVTLTFLTHCKYLEVLDLHYTCIKNLPETLKCPNMREFMVKKCLTIQMSVLLQLIQSFPNLEKIFLKIETLISNQIISEVFQGFPYLKNLSICDCESLTDEVFGIIRKQKHLQVLRFWGFQVDESVIKQAFKNHPRRLKFNSIKLPAI